ncbi:MAG: TPM domain-containing protein [Bryobacteraceae bacterium]
MLRKVSTFAVALGAALVLLAPTAPALDTAKLKPQGYVSDFAHALDPGARAKLERYCYVIEQSTGAQIALVTVDTLDGEPIEDAANRLYREWGVGKKQTNEGMLLLFAIKDHKDRAEVGYGLEPIAPDGYVGGVLRSIQPELRAGQYAEAFAGALQQIGGHIAQAKGVTLSDAPVSRASPSQRQSLPWPFIVIGLVILLFLLSSGGGRGFLAGMILGNLFGGGRGGFGGGGFGGGGGGGGGFGGFGGGDSGGGGASSGW